MGTNAGVDILVVVEMILRRCACIHTTVKSVIFFLRKGER
jgi:hypothetical protein